MPLPQVLNDNSLSYMPTELGRMTSFVGGTQWWEGFTLNSNKFCSDVPTQVQALSSQVAYWAVTTGTDFGTPCCETLPDKYTCAPTPPPTPVPSSFPTAIPSPIPTHDCDDGYEWNGASCSECGGGVPRFCGCAERPRE